MIKIQSLYHGLPKPLKARPEQMSSINRKEVESLIIHLDHIEGDEVANKVHHGGPNRVLHHYPQEHLQHWQKLYPESNFAPGSMGENLSSLGILEKDVCIGDIFEIGTLLCQVTEPRKPCYTINLQFGIKGLAREVQNQIRTGWFYKILKPGVLNKNDSVVLKERPFPELTVESCVKSLLLKSEPETLKLIANNPVISENWRKPAQNFLIKNEMPDDRKRLGE